MTNVAKVSKNAEAREKILGLQQAVENAVKSGELGESYETLTHHFAPGLYAREMLIPAGHVIVGKIHRHAHVNTICSGRIRVYTEFGFDVYEGPVTFVSQPGTKRAVYAETDTIWITYHPTVVCEVETDLEKIETQVIAPSFDEYDALPYTEIKGLIQ